MTVAYRNGSRHNQMGGRMPLTVFVPGTKRKTMREIEGEGSCKYCKEQKKTLYSYEDSGEAFCNRSCWIVWMFEGRQPKRFLREVDELAQEEEQRKAMKNNVVPIGRKAKTTRTGGSRRTARKGA